MTRDEFKYQMYLRILELRGIELQSDKDEREIYGFLGHAWDKWLDPLAEQAGF